MRCLPALLALSLTPSCIPRVTGVVRRPDAPLLTLAEKADRYARDLANHHLSPEGLLLYAGPTEARERGRPLPRERYGGLADQAAWTGCLLASEVFRHAATGETEALGAARRTARALAFLQKVTGTPGYLARSAYEGAPLDGRFRPGAPPLERFAWHRDTSRDQYAMVLFGYATALARCEDPELRAETASAAGAICDHIFENGFEIREDGRRTTHGNLSGRILGIVPNGVNAGIVLLAAKVAAVATGEERHLRRYEGLVREGWPGRVRTGFFRILGTGNPNNDNMTLLCLDGLLSLEREERIRRGYLDALEKGWRLVRGTGNALFAAVVHRDLGARAEGAFDEAVESLRLFPAEKVRFATDNRDLLPALGRSFLPGRDLRPRTSRPVPVHRRTPGSFLWKEDPYVVVDSPNARGEEEFSGVDYLLPYWMLRASGLEAKE
ncbi:MAG TPA: hypothetical protein VFI25_08225 [Planctomycetota bacterium]|nr:hypothetical protein [Planctomycetota bacterium]